MIEMKGLSTGRILALMTAGAILLSGACSRRPKEILDEKEMINLMADLQLAEAYSNTHVDYEDGVDGRTALTEGVLVAHGVTHEQFDTTLGWYGKNLDEFVELYAKVDKELLKRRRKLMKESEPLLASGNGSDLWPFTKNGTVMPLSLYDGWVMSLPDPDMNSGDRLIWSMHLTENFDLVGQLGVEYSDGSGESTTMNRGRQNRFEMTLQTDTGKTVSRLYATLRVKDRKSLPLFADSIKLEKLPYDSLEYKISRSQKRYSKPTPIMTKSNSKDSVKSKIDGKELTDSLKKMNEGSPISPGEEKGSVEKPLKNRQEKLQPTTPEGELKWQPRK